MATGKTDSTKSKNEVLLTEEETVEEYAVNYVVNISNCENCTINIYQTGKPSGGDPPPGGD